MIQSLAKIGWVGLLSISLCLQMAWAGPFDACPCVQSCNPSDSPTCTACVSQAAPEPSSTHFANTTDSSCCCSQSGLPTDAGPESISSKGKSNAWALPSCDCGLHSLPPSSPGVISELTLSPRGPQPSMLPSVASWQVTCSCESPRFVLTRVDASVRHFSQRLLCVWLI